MKFSEEHSSRSQRPVKWAQVHSSDSLVTSENDCKQAGPQPVHRFVYILEFSVFEIPVFEFGFLCNFFPIWPFYLAVLRGFEMSAEPGNNESRAVDPQSSTEEQPQAPASSAEQSCSADSEPFQGSNKRKYEPAPDVAKRPKLSALSQVLAGKSRKCFDYFGLAFIFNDFGLF